MCQNLRQYWASTKNECSCFCSCVQRKFNRTSTFCILIWIAFIKPMWWCKKIHASNSVTKPNKIIRKDEHCKHRNESFCYTIGCDFALWPGSKCDICIIVWNGCRICDVIAWHVTVWLSMWHVGRMDDIMAWISTPEHADAWWRISQKVFYSLVFLVLVYISNPKPMPLQSSTLSPP